jgi:hypothetical protein
VSGLKIGTRSKLLVATLGLIMMTGCVVAPNHGYYDPNPYGYSPYGYSSGAVVLNYRSYSRPRHGHRHWDRGRGHRHWR